MDIYMDAEFDGVRKGKRFIQCLISIGLIAIDKECVIDSYYSLIRPRRFHSLSSTVKRITKLSDKEILNARSFETVMDEVNDFLKRNQYDRLYTFGPDDVRTLKHQAVYEGYGRVKAFTNFYDLQKQISNEIHFEGKIAADMFSLDDLKYIYGIANKVEHNALNDAVDLYLLHEAYVRGAIQSERLSVIAERKRQKLEDARKRNLIHMQNILFERYHFYEHQQKSCALCPEVYSQLESLQDRGFISLPLTILAMYITHSFEQGKLTMEWLMYPQPMVELSIELEDEAWHQGCSLTYSNAGALERIWHICEGNHD